jgi:DNA helicase II / ATP-dependent DNA helicase PcrA
MGQSGTEIRRTEVDLLSRLNDRQREAVLFGDGALLILAGAGSGKTRVLTHRVAHLVQARGVLPHSILAFTFTNKAAREMKERIIALIGDVPGLWVGTFHSICLRILRANAERVERTPS